MTPWTRRTARPTGIVTRPWAYRNPDGSLRLDEILGARHARHYIRILNSSSEEFRAMQLRAAVDAAGDDGWQRTAAAVPGVRVSRGQVIVREGNGPDQFSTCTELDLPTIWDVCGYYRRLGFAWGEFRNVTRRDLRDRLLDLDPAQEDADLFYAAAQLRDPAIRARYDAMPFGGLFMEDRDVAAMFQRAAVRVAVRQAARLRDRGITDPERLPTRESVLAAWGMVAADEVPPESEPEGDGGDDVLGATLSGWDRYWSWHRMVAPGEDSADPVDPAVLEEWQRLLVAAFAARGNVARIAVGIWPGAGPKVWRDSNESCIVFLGKDEHPTEDMAYAAEEGHQLEASIQKEAVR